MKNPTRLNVQSKAIDLGQVCRTNLRLSFCLFVFVLSILAAGGAFAQTPSKAIAQDTAAVVSLNDYLLQVSEKHKGYKAADQAAKGARLSSQEALLITRPNLIGSGTNTVSGQANPLTEDSTRTRTSLYSLGLSQATTIGVNGQITLNQNELGIPSFPEYSANWTQFDLSVSLLRNFGGREIRAQQGLIESGALARAFGQSHTAKAILLEAESAYWRLALAREMVTVQKEALSRAEKVNDWTKRRVRLQLADRAEGLQASTNLQARRLELRLAEDEVRAASQAFNSSRGIKSNEVQEKLVDISPDLIATMGVPERSKTRDDVKAAELQAKAAGANAQVQRERNTPTLELFGSAPLTEPDAPANPTLNAVLPQTFRPGTTIGLRLTAPLDVFTQSRVREGYNSEATASEYTYERKVFEEQRDWEDLTAKFLQAKERLKLYQELEKTQREKLDYERDRQQRGRSTLQQVLFFENDFEQAQLGRIRTLAEILTLNAQMKLYGVSYESR